ncbi:Hypothetical predicted protein, partial [Mytilus galloprovincialis]
MHFCKIFYDWRISGKVRIFWENLSYTSFLCTFLSYQIDMFTINGVVPIIMTWITFYATKLKDKHFIQIYEWNYTFASFQTTQTNAKHLQYKNRILLFKRDQRSCYSPIKKPQEEAVQERLCLTHNRPRKFFYQTKDSLAGPYELGVTFTSKCEKLSHCFDNVCTVIPYEVFRSIKIWHPRVHALVLYNCNSDNRFSKTACQIHLEFHKVDNKTNHMKYRNMLISCKRFTPLNPWKFGGGHSTPSCSKTCKRSTSPPRNHIYSWDNKTNQMKCSELSYLSLKKNRFRYSCFADDCLKWYSPLDGIYRHHCYWYKRSTISTNAFEANRLCAEDGHGLAPYIDTKQYNYVEGLRPNGAGETFIGVMDVAVEDTWTHLDGSSIANNDFWSTFWFDADLRLNQPNGGTDQNCAVINKRSFRLPNKTQDKSCTTVFRDEMLCYKKVNCLKWNSTADQVYREHCYWFTNKPSSLTSWTIVDAMNKCRDDGGYLAPLIDDLNYQFIRDDVLSTVFSLKSTQVWIGTHSIIGSPSNWNNDPAFVSLLSPSSSSEKCVVIDSNQIQSWEPCNTNSSALTGAVCFKHGLAGDIPLISPEPITCEPEISSVNINSTTVEELKRILFIDPEHTNAYKLTKISVYEDRPVAKAIGGVGVAILISVILFIVLLDCQRMEQCISKKKTNTSTNM